MNMDSILIAIISYAFGIGTGYVGRWFFDKERTSNVSPNTFVLVAVTIIWTISMLVDIASPTYETSPFVHGLMGAIVGFFFKPWQGKDTK
jgi:hypothetical protein